MTFLKKGDIAVIIITALIGAGLIPLLFMGSQSANTARVYIDGQLHQTLRLDKDDEYEINKNGIEMTLAVKDGAVAVTHSNCRDKLCVHMGYISRGNRSIICLPNRVVIRTDDNTDAPDAVIG
ncbi:MAG: NusG domain II-containing protein [Eubacteriales bacterium]